MRRRSKEMTASVFPSGRRDVADDAPRHLPAGSVKTHAPTRDHGARIWSSMPMRPNSGWIHPFASTVPPPSPRRYVTPPAELRRRYALRLRRYPAMQFVEVLEQPVQGALGAQDNCGGERQVHQAAVVSLEYDDAVRVGLRVGKGREGAVGTAGAVRHETPKRALVVGHTNSISGDGQAGLAIRTKRRTPAISSNRHQVATGDTRHLPIARSTVPPPQATVTVPQPGSLATWRGGRSASMSSTRAPP